MAKRVAKSRTLREPESALIVDPLWYKDAVIYQLHVRSFFDSDNDGVGDFAGLTRKLDYLQDLGVTALWLLPFYPSPLRDDGYDIASYTAVNPAYGDLRDFKLFVRESHARGLRVITELVINHTSDQHPWFQRARVAPPGSVERDYYVWSDTPERYREARIIFKDFEVSNWSWDPVAKAYYWHRFYSHQPDLNFDNPHVQESLFEVLDYWLNMGVDGLRLDAVPYLYEREGTNCENLPETHAFLKLLRKRIDASFTGRMLLAEANQWPEDAIAYFGDGDECNTAFHFPVMPRLFMAIHMEDRFPIVDILQQTPPIPPDCQWLIFLRNHDELTLEMVTDEERDYMYRVYARDRQARINLGIRRRLAPLLGNNRRKIELMNGLLCSLPGTPVIYYGDEIGMGDNIYLGDRHGVRTPMQWSPDRNAGFSEANPQRLFSPVIIDSEYLFESVNVETQQNNPSSLLWWMKRLVALRQNYPPLSRGSLELLSPENSRILAFTRDYEDQSVLMVANLSRFVQFVELDLSRFAGRRPIELFGQSAFPPITKAPYVLTLGPHAFFWFALEHEGLDGAPAAAPEAALPRITVPAGHDDLARGRLRRSFERVLTRQLPKRRWFGDRSRDVQSVHVVASVPLGRPTRAATRLVLLKVDYLEGEPAHYLLPLGNGWGDQAERISEAMTPALIATMQRGKETGVLFDATLDPGASTALLETMVHRRRLKGSLGGLIGWADQELVDLIGDAHELPSTVLRSEQGENAIVLGDKLLLKLFRRLESGLNPDREISQFLARDSVRFPYTLPVIGALEYQLNDEDVYTLGVLRSHSPDMVTGWLFAQDALSRYFEHVMTQPVESRPGPEPAPRRWLWELAQGEAPVLAKDLLGATLEWSALLGRRTGELHLALASDCVDAAFAPESFTQFYQRSLYQSSRKLALQTFQKLRRAATGLSDEVQAAARNVLDREKQVLEQFRGIVGHKISAQRIRCHGDYHLERVLYTGKDFLIVDFESQRSQSVASRRIKRSAFEDVASMIHSFEFAATQALAKLSKVGTATPEALAAWRNAWEFWSVWVSSAFLRAYATATAESDLLPKSTAQMNLLLQFFLMQNAVQELRHELDDGSVGLAAALERILDLASG